MKDTFERLLSVLLTVAALTIAAVLVRREWRGPQVPELPRGAAASPRRVTNWDELRSTGLALLAPDAGVLIVEFADLECPACKGFHARLRQILADIGPSLAADVGLVMVHYPLETHRFARPAARALECAYGVGAGSRFVDVAYAKQDSFGLKSWSSYAAEAGVGDTLTFARCARDTTRIERIERGRTLGEALRLEGTPTIVMNGWYFPRLPTDTELRAALKAVAAGQAPAGATLATTAGD